MKGTVWNGSHFATKGTSRSTGEGMFSVGGLVAFSYHHFSSPDGRSYSEGCCPTSTTYVLQDEIVLEEYNKTSRDGYGGGNYDAKSIVQLKDVFWHESRSSRLPTKTFLLQILGTEKNVFLDSFIEGDIAEVRNNPGKYLHIYEIPENYRGCKTATFQGTVEKINLQKMQEDQLDAEKVQKSYRGVELTFGITESGWYASRASFGWHSIKRQHEHDSTRRTHHGLVIMPCVPNNGTYDHETKVTSYPKGQYLFYMGDTPMSLLLVEGQHPQIDTHTRTHWANSQNWEYLQIEDLNIEKGWIFVNGVDVYEGTKERVEANKAARLAARISRFEEAKTRAEASHVQQVITAALRQKGNVIAALTVLGNSAGMQDDPQTVIKAMKLAAKASAGFGGVFENLLAIISAGVSPGKAEKIAAKAGSWKYLNDCCPGVSFTGYFNEAMEALEIYSKNWEGKIFSTSGQTEGQGDLAVKLASALRRK